MIGNATRPEPEVTATAAITTPVVVVAPEVLALSPDGRIAFEGDGAIRVHAARTVDAEAWLPGRSTTFVTGFAEWNELSTRVAARVVPPDAPPSPEPNPSASPSPSPAPADDEET